MGIDGDYLYDGSYDDDQDAYEDLIDWACKSSGYYDPDYYDEE